MPEPAGRFPRSITDRLDALKYELRETWLR